ncbi:HTH psq-type domain-containing protein [Sergentomyia squamirostris]
MPKKLLYTQEALKNALSSVRNGVSVRKTSRNFGIPASTLFDKLSGKTQEEKYAGQTVLSIEEEKRFVEWIHKRAEMGFPVTKDELKDSVALYVKLRKTKNRFKNNRPGRTWLKNFLKRHPDVAKRTPQNLSTRRAKVTKKDIDGWFSEVQKYLEEAGLNDCDPSRIFNCDETAFFLCPPVDEVLAEKGVRSVHTLTNGNERIAITLLFMGSAAGELLSPMIVLPFTRTPGEVTNSIPEEWILGRSSSGWMTAETFYEYIVNTFYPTLVEKKIQFPVILYVDGHSSHLTLPLSDFCANHGIEIIRLFPNATHVLQPLDVGFFAPIKKVWRNKRYSWNILNPNVKFEVKHLAPLLEETMMSMDEKEILKNSFRHSGLHPFNSQAIDISKLVSEARKEETQPESSTSCSMDTNIITDLRLNCPILEAIKNRIPDDILRQFQDCEHSQWKGPPKYADLFLAWLHFKDVLLTVSEDDNRCFAELPGEFNQIAFDSGAIDLSTDDQYLAQRLLEQITFDIIPEDTPHAPAEIVTIVSTEEVNKDDTSDSGPILIVVPPHQMNSEMEIDRDEKCSFRPEEVFKDVLRYPQLAIKDEKTPRKRLPAAITSRKWRAYKREVELKKEKDANDLKERKEVKKQKKIAKEKLDAEKKMEREEKNKQRVEKKQKEEEQKNLKRKLKMEKENKENKIKKRKT